MKNVPKSKWCDIKSISEEREEEIFDKVDRLGLKANVSKEELLGYIVMMDKAWVEEHREKDKILVEHRDNVETLLVMYMRAVLDIGEGTKDKRTKELCLKAMQDMWKMVGLYFYCVHGLGDRVKGFVLADMPGDIWLTLKQKR